MNEQSLSAQESDPSGIHSDFRTANVLCPSLLPQPVHYAREAQSLEGVNYSQETDMNAALFVAIFAAIFVAIFLPLILSGNQWREEQDRARERRMAEHRMNARLLRLNI